MRQPPRSPVGQWRRVAATAPLSRLLLCARNSARAESIIKRRKLINLKLTSDLFSKDVNPVNPVVSCKPVILYMYMYIIKLIKLKLKEWGRTNFSSLSFERPPRRRHSFPHHPAPVSCTHKNQVNSLYIYAYFLFLATGPNIGCAPRTGSLAHWHKPFSNLSLWLQQ